MDQDRWSFSSQKNDKMIFSLVWNAMLTDYWKVLVLNFPEMEYTVFFEPKSWWKDDIYWLQESSYFVLSGDGKYGLFLTQKVNGKMIFTDYWKGLVLNFFEMGNWYFLCQIANENKNVRELSWISHKVGQLWRLIKMIGRK